MMTIEPKNGRGNRIRTRDLRFWRPKRKQGVEPNPTSQYPLAQTQAFLKMGNTRGNRA